MKSLSTRLCAGLILMVSGIGAHAQAPDNSKTNKRDRDSAAVTPDQQKAKDILKETEADAVSSTSEADADFAVADEPMRR